ncbi:hypothetical protein FRC06_008559 [Ceratobasidium sp. 370]|nr:hypothetical protein FRC06_008559 [Ceratobasidium sp. 370]
MADYLDLSDRRNNVTVSTRYPGYPDLVFAQPRRHDLVPQRFCRKVATYLSTILEIPKGVILAELRSRKLEQWGRMQQTNKSGGGDVIRADDVGCDSELITRNASYVKFYSYLSRWNWNNTAPRLVNEVTSFGCVECFIVIDIGFIRHLSEITHAHIARTDPVIIAILSPFVALKQFAESGLIEYKLASGGKLAPAEIADVNDIDCLIGRVRTASASYVVDRTTVVGRLNQLDVTVNPD